METPTITPSNEQLAGTIKLSARRPNYTLPASQAEFRGAHACLLLCKLDLHTCIMHMLISWQVALTDVSSECRRTCARIFSVPIFERRARHVCSVVLNNSSDVGIAATAAAAPALKKHPPHSCNVTVFICITWQALIAALLNITACHTRKKSKSIRPNERRQTTPSLFIYRKPLLCKKI